MATLFSKAIKGIGNAVKSVATTAGKVVSTVVKAVTPIASLIPGVGSLVSAAGGIVSGLLDKVVKQSPDKAAVAQTAADIATQLLESQESSKIVNAILEDGVIKEGEILDTVRKFFGNQSEEVILLAAEMLTEAFIQAGYIIGEPALAVAPVAQTLTGSQPVTSDVLVSSSAYLAEPFSIASFWTKWKWWLIGGVGGFGVIWYLFFKPKRGKRRF
jgi:hypothetical protein